jgi:hypothetical protein
MSPRELHAPLTLIYSRRIHDMESSRAIMKSFILYDPPCGLVVRVTTDPEVWVRFPALSDFLRGSGTGMGNTQPREYN